VDSYFPEQTPVNLFPVTATNRDLGEGVMNNFSMFTADRMTHVKIVAMALVCATLVAGIGVAAHVTDSSATAAGQIEATVIKAGKPVTASTSDNRIVR
jgi:ABC-type proline/glycine betaine transport system permease subunit